LFLLSAGGPAALSFNEFNPIFNRNGITAQAGSLLGEEDTYAGEGIIAGIYDKAAFSIGGLHFTTDGWRKNADQQDDIANAFVQFELSPQTSIQGEYRYRNAETGDLQLRFFPSEFFPGQRRPLETNTYRLGGRHAFSPNSILLASFIYSDADFGAFDKQPFVAPDLVTFLGVKEPQEAYTGELQHIFRSQYFNLTSGLGLFDRNSSETFTVRTVLPFPDDATSARSRTDLWHTNVYAYSYVNLIKNVTFTFGASGDFTDGNSADIKGIDQFNPKFGIVWEPIPGTTLRAAAFRALKRSLITNQTLEPTQVAGFNQFYDDFNGTKAWRYGGAIDQKFIQNLFGGLEFSKRDLKVPFLDFSEDPENPNSRRVNWDEYLGRAYLFWTPHPWFALRTEYQYERVKRAQELTDGVRKLDTHRVPLGVNFFHPSGVSASLTATYFNQGGKFESIKTGELRSGNDDFWLVDAAVNYRLPKRYGFITLGATNLFDNKFKYFDIDFKNPSIRPERMFFARVTLAFP
jgi:hypothetical protein